MSANPPVSSILERCLILALAELHSDVECGSILEPGGNPRPGSLDDDFRDYAEQLTVLIKDIEAVIGRRRITYPDWLFDIIDGKRAL